MKSFRILLTFVLTAVSICVQALESGQTIRLINSGLSVFVKNSLLDENKPAVLWTETNVNAQRWTVSARTNGTFQLQNDYTNFYLGGLTSGSGGKVGQISRSGAGSKGSWDFVPVEGTTNQYIIYQGTTKKYALAVPESPVEGDTLLIVNTAASTPIDQARITWTVEVVEPMAKEFTKDKRDDMMEKWKARCYKKASTGYVIGGGGFWGDAEMFEIVLDALETTGDQQYATMFENLYTNFISRKTNNWISGSGYNQFNDDIAWICIACIRAYLLTGVTKYKTTAKTNFDGMFARADCYGNDLLQWKHNSGQGTNSCINGPAAVCACYLAIAEADESYYDKARKTYMAERGKLFEMSNGKPTGAVWDSYDQASGNYNKWCSTYNQGTNLGAAIMLYNHYGEQMFKDDADAIIRWSESHMANSQGLIHVCQTVSGDLCGFKGIMIRYLRMYAESFNAPSHYAWIAKNAYHAWNNRNSAGITSSAWLTKAEENFKHQEGSELKNFGNEGNMTCVSAAFNCHLGAVDAHDAYVKNEAEDFNFVRNAPVTYESNADEDNGGMVGPMKVNNYIGYRRVDFGDNPASHIELRAKVATNSSGINVFLDQPNATKGILLCTIKGNEFPARKAWENITKMINEPVTGVHDVYFVSTGSGTTSSSNINWWQFHSNSSIYADLTNGAGTLLSSFSSDDISAITDDNILTAETAQIEAGAEAWIEYQSTSPMRIYGYQFYSGKNSSANPKGWALLGSNDGENWDTLHVVPEANISVKSQRFYADIENENDYTRCRLLFDLNQSQGILSISEWQLMGHHIDDNDLTSDGGTITEGKESLIDKLGSTLLSAPITAVYHPTGNYRLSAYSITAGAKEQAPTSWKLEGTTNGTTWQVIDQQTDAIFPYDNYTYVCRVNPATSYVQYRLNVNGQEVGINQWQLFGKLDFGKYYTDLTSVATIVASQGTDSEALFDKDGNTFASLTGTNMYWDMAIPVAAKILAYSLVAADNAELNPKNVTLYGLDESGTETQLSNKAINFTGRGARITVTVATTKLFNQFRLRVEGNEGNSVKLADFELYGAAIADASDPILHVPASVTATADGLSSTELIKRIHDCNRTTQYRAAFAEPVSITYEYPDTISINAYSIMAGKNEPTRNPSDWVLEGTNDGQNWTLLDSRNGELFSQNYATQFYYVESSAAYSTYRLTVNAVNGGNQLQICELQLLSIEPVQPTKIEEIAHEQQTDDSRQAIYDLSGRMVNGKLPKGIYIMKQGSTNAKSRKILVR